MVQPVWQSLACAVLICLLLACLRYDGTGMIDDVNQG
jgi:hypothetical protein